MHLDGASHQKMVQICADLKGLRQTFKRERFVLPTLEDFVPKSTITPQLNTLDTSLGFWQIL